MRRVMIVEGDQVLTEMMVELLGREGCVVTTVTSFAEAVSCVPRMGREVDMLIVDADTVKLNIPKEILAQWHSWLSGCVHPPTWVVVSVSVSPVRHRSFLLAGSERSVIAGGPAIWLRKPFRNEEFLSVVRHTPGGNPGGPEAPGNRALVTSQRRQT